jgi:NitT/TauT family transport system substrate-binding protein
MKNRTRLTLALVGVILALLVIGAFILSDDDDATDDEQGAGLTKITLFLTFVPNVQFAPIYAAIENGYFAEEGLVVEIVHGDEPDGVDRLAVNDLQFGIISGEQVLIARGAEKPLVYVLEWYHRFPVGIVVPAESEIEAPADLAGKTISIPGPFGASYMGFLALLNAVDLTENDLTVQTIGFTAPAVMCERQVDGAVVYIANEPLQISSCYEVRVLEISDYVNLISNGLVTNEKTIREKPELVEKMVRALRRGIEFSIADPNAAFDLSLPYLGELGEDQYDTQREILRRSTELWQAENIGETTLQGWETTQTALLNAGLMSAPLTDLNAAYSNAFLPTTASE